MLEIKDEAEIILLGKIISYVKFKAIDDESAFISCSPFINSLSDKVTSELQRLNLGGKNSPSSIRLKDYARVKDVVINKLRNHPNWDDIGFDVKKELIINVAYPYSVNEDELEEIVKEISH